MKLFLRWMVSSYQYFISPLKPSVCRFYPSCSSYALEALDVLPLHKAIFAILLRILRCNPYFSGGYDPVEKVSSDGK